MIVVDINIISYLYITGNRSQQSEDLLSFDSNWIALILWRSEFRNVLAQYLDAPLITADKKIICEFPDVAQTAESYLA